MDGIQIFACDHRKNVEWNLPYIRIGGPESDCSLNIKDDKEIEPYSICMSEGAKMWWCWKYLKEFGDPDYIGFCHYRRFFTMLNNKLPIINITQHMFNINMCMQPLAQLIYMKNNNIDVIVPTMFNVVNSSDSINILDKACNDGLGLTHDIMYYAAEKMVNYLPSNLKEHARQYDKLKYIFPCNIFTIKKELANIYFDSVIPALIDTYNSIDPSQLKNMHPRFLGYIQERLTTIFIHSLSQLKHNIAISNLLTIDGNKHVQWQPPEQASK